MIKHDTDAARRQPEQTALSRTLANTETLQIAEIHLMDAFCTPIEERFERITRLAVRALHTPVVAITAVSRQTQWFKSVFGWDICELPVADSLCARTVQKGQPTVVQDLSKHVRYSNHPLVTTDPKFRFYASAPLLNMKGTVVGTLCAMDFKPRQVTRGLYQSLLDLADLAQRELLTGALHNAQSALVSKLSVARRQALIDPLTKTWNRRGGMMLLEESLEAAKRERKSVAVLAVDVNDFKCVNDGYGHAAGDKALQMVARELLACVRDNDGVSRFGGDEFFVVITGVTETAVNQIAQRVQKRIQQNAVEAQNGRLAKVSVAIGVKWVPADNTSAAEELLAEADKALYESKLIHQLSDVR